MTKEKKILLNYILYIIVGIIICFIGITGVFADTTVDTSQFFTVTGRKWSAGSLEFSSDPSFNNDWLLNAYNVTGGIYTPPNSYDYIEFSYFEHNTSQFNPCNSSGKFTAEFNLLFTSATFNQYVSSVKWGNDSCSIQERNQDGTMKISCVASPSSNNYTDIFVYYNDIQGTATSSLYISRNIAITCGLNTDAIINNDNANTQNIINNNSQNTQDIIDNQNQNTQDMIDSQKVCSPTKKESTKRYSSAYYSNPDNNIFANAGNTSWGWGETNTIGSVNTMSGTVKIVWEKITSSTQYGSPQFRLYTNEITQTESTPLTDSGSTILENVNNSTIKIAFKAGIGNRYKWEIYSEECKNGNQVLDDSINNLNDTLNDDTVDDNNIASSFEDFNDFLDDNSTITQLLTLPITLYTAILNNVNGSCSPFNLGALYGENLILPCINVSQYLGSTLWNMIDIIISGFAIFAISKKMIKVFNNFSSLREGDVIDD